MMPPTMNHQIYLEFFRVIHSDFFPNEPSDSDLERRFIQAIDVYYHELLAKKQIDLQYILDKNLNFQSIELALRLMRLDTNVTALFKVYSFLIEVKKPYSALFDIAPTSWIVAFLSLCSASARSVFLLALGRWQIRRHHLV